jgi:glutamyl-tRNA synthetase
VGSARAALFNWLFARHHGGGFVLRIEDTDRERSTEESIEHIYESMRWLGLDWDELYRQTDRTQEHQTAAEFLMERDLAYEHEGAWWFRVPTEGETVVQDAIQGEVRFDHEQFKDLVIRRSDGSFVYNFVVVVDDADMGITHVIRGDDHLINTPKQIQLYQALERPLPQFAHLPMVLGPDRSRLSKRHGAASVTEYREQGILPEALVNFLARLGWAHGDQEIFDRDELIEQFTLEGVGTSGAIFDAEKLLWVNQQQMKRMDPGELAQRVKPWCLKRGTATEAQWEAIEPERLHLGIELLRERSKTLVELADVMEILFADGLRLEEPITLEAEERAGIAALAEALEAVEPFVPAGVEEAIRASLAARAMKLKTVAPALRMAVTGRRVGPGLFEVIAAAGKPLAVRRLRAICQEEGDGE